MRGLGHAAPAPVTGLADQALRYVGNILSGCETSKGTEYLHESTCQIGQASAQHWDTGRCESQVMVVIA